MKLSFLLFLTSLLAVGCTAQTSQDKGAAQSPNKLTPQTQKPQPVPEPESGMKKLRDMALTTPPKEIGFDSSRADYKVYGVLMETGYPEGLATLVSLRDGTASLYLGHGGGVLGGISHEGVRKAATDFVKESEKYLGRMKGTKSFPYPAVGQVKFYLLTFDGVVTAEADENALGEGGHELSPLFYKGHEVLSQLRRMTEEEK